MKVLAASGRAFIAGGVVALIGQAILVALSLTPLYSMGLSMIVALLLMGVIGGLLYVSGISPKLEEWGGMGLMMSFIGLPPGIAAMFNGIAQATGSKTKAFIGVIINFFLKILMLATAICVGIAVIYLLTNFGLQYAAPYAPGGLITNEAGIPIAVDPMGFVWAFLFGGALGAVGQFISMTTKLPLTPFFIGLIVIGALLFPFGIMKAWAMIAGAGVTIFVVGAGEALVSTFLALVMGMPLPFILVIAMFVFLVLFGCLMAVIRMSIDAKKQSADDGVEGEPA